ncbi:type I restriction enzyme, S subunit [Tessaracoccus bendigoensis DSM 12906]|uniref:Type I restriction enzyme, S subunit n=2 Tax=Tessaracoccus TaxID=72763 RepID=A0A1M6MAY9_9ACTN|nr:type I restriction enzyme, S subunit [Tessaracoccus bendigoensis DSM 12906]
MIRGSNLSLDVGSRLDERSLVFVGADVAEKHPRSIARAGDLVFTSWGTVGQVGIIPADSRFSEYLVSNKQMRLTVDPGRVSPLFLYYQLSQQQVVEQILGEAIGSSIPGFNLGQLRQLKVCLPDLATQADIADVLGALDDKIAANERVLDSVLALAHLHFAQASREAQREWLTYDDVVEVQGGGTPRTDIPEYWEGPIRWATPTDVTALKAPVLFETGRTITEAGLSACSSQLHEPTSILMTSRATIGAFAWAARPVAVNQGFIVAKAKDPMAQLWLFFEMQSRVDDYLAHANGATFLELSRSTFKRLPVAWPTSPSTLERFNRTVQPLLDLTAALVQENERLTATRDALLPELMSGRLTVDAVRDRASM